MLVSLACSQSIISSKSVEDFKTDDKNWSEAHIVTSSNPKDVKISIEDNELKFDLRAENSYVYRFYGDKTYKDVTIDAEVTNSGNYQGIAFICHAAPDKGEWYEFRISVGGQFELFHYDQKLKDRQAKNPYVRVDQVTATDVMNLTKPNQVKVTCKGSNMALEINGEEVLAKQSGEFLSEGLVGIGVLAFDRTPVIVSFNQITIQK